MSLRNMVDAHTHGHMLPYEGWVTMARQGITRAVSCAIVIMARHAESYFDHFRSLREFYRQLAAAAGVQMYSAVGVHPAGIPEDWSRVVDRLPALLEAEDVVAVGEIGMNQDSQLERDVFRAQLEVARECGVPAIVHTPKHNREYIVERILDLAAGVGMPPAGLIVDHANLDVIKQVRDFGAVPGITVREQNVTPEVLAGNLDLFAGGMINSDYSNIHPNDPTGVSKAAEYLMARGVDPAVVASLTRDKAVEVYGL